MISAGAWSWIFFALMWSGGYVRGRWPRVGEWYAIANQPVWIVGAIDMGMTGSIATSGLVLLNASLALWRIHQRRRGVPDTIPGALRAAWARRRTRGQILTIPVPPARALDIEEAA